MALTPKQEQFCQEYLIDLNATQAAIRCGYSPKTARSIANELLTKPDISARVSALQAKRAQRTEVTADRVLKEYAKLGFLDIRKAFDEDGNLIPLKQLDDETAAAVAGLEFEEVFEMQGSGEDRKRVHVGRIHKIKLSDKRAALDSIAKHLGMFVDRVELSGNVVDILRQRFAKNADSPAKR